MKRKFSKIKMAAPFASVLFEIKIDAQLKGIIWWVILVSVPVRRHPQLL
jgi:hypothetical protein